MTEKSLAASLAAAQKDMKNATMNKVNPHFKSKYADLGAIRDAIIPCLAGQGIALVQAIETREHGPVVITSLLKGDETISSECPVIIGPKVTAQQFGSALTYARRYSMAAIVGIASEEDDDGNAATEGGETPAPKTTEDAAAGVLKKTKDSRSKDWKGPMTKTELQRSMKAFFDLLDGVHGPQELRDLEDEYLPILQQCEADMPQWWNEAAENFIPAKDRIEDKRQQLMEYGGQA